MMQILRQIRIVICVIRTWGTAEHAWSFLFVFTVSCRVAKCVFCLFSSLQDVGTKHTVWLRGMKLFRRCSPARTNLVNPWNPRTSNGINNKRGGGGGRLKNPARRFPEHVHACHDENLATRALTNMFKRLRNASNLPALARLWQFTGCNLIARWRIRSANFILYSRRDYVQWKT